MGQFSVIAHRGASSLAPENTLPAFNLAVQHGAQMVELDVHLSKDGHVVVIHDQTLQRTTTGHGQIHEYTLAQLKRLDAGAWFSPMFINCHIPTLQEVYAALPRHMSVNIELKTDAAEYQNIEEKVLAIVKQFRAYGRTVISSFNWNSLQLIHRLEPKTKLALLFTKFTPTVWSTAQLVRAFSLHPAAHIVKQSLVWQAHCWGYRIYPWVVNETGAMLELKAMGVDGIITDCPQIFHPNKGN